MGSNQRLQRQMRERGVQRKLTVNEPDDKYEKEAEQVAEQVLHASAERRATADATGREPRGGGRGGSAPPAANPIVDRAPRIDESPGSGGAGGDQQTGEDVDRALDSTSGGKPLPPAARSFFEPRFGRGFGDVRVHTGKEAADLNRKLDATAFTHGSDVYFGEGQYRPETRRGKKLLGHELTHVIQQTGGRRTVAEMIQRNGNGNGNGGAKQETAQDDGSMTSLLPGYAQKGDTCGAASLVSALVIWDRQRREQGEPAHLVESAINNVLTWLTRHRDRTIAAWNEKGYDGAGIYQEIVQRLTVIRDHARQPGATISEFEYQAIGLALYYLYVDETTGLSASEIGNLQAKLGLESTKSEHAGSFAGIFQSSVLQGLRPGRIAQVGWYVRTSEPDPEGNVNLGHHVFLIGRFNDGGWFLSDQGQTPPFEVQAPTLVGLRAKLAKASQSGRSWVFTGTLKQVLLGGWTGVKPLGDPEAIRKAGVLSKGRFLAEVDAGLSTYGERVVAGEFVSRHYDRSEAHFAAGGLSGNGALIVEMPKGVFSVYKTNTVSDENAKVNSIDESAGGLLTKRTFLSAELVLNSGQVAKLLQVY